MLSNNMNFNPFGNEMVGEGGGGGSFPLMRQSSVYSLTLDEFQSSLGKDFGSVNMDELLKSIWSAEETLNPPSTTPAVASGGNYQGGSITLPRTLTVKTVEEVWREMNTETIPHAQRQPTLGEMTLEEFLVRAGVVREDNQLDGKPNPGGFWGDLGPPNANAANNDSGFGFTFQQPRDDAHLTLQPTNLQLNTNGVRCSQPQSIAPQLPQPHQHPIFPKQSTGVSYSPVMASPGIRGGVVGLPDPTTNSASSASALQGGAMPIVGSPSSFSSDRLKRNRDTPDSVSPIPYVFNGGVRGRRSNDTVEKVIERRHKRMIKNRESAARSRQRKQAYTTELEEEITKLKDENKELQHRQEKFIEMQKKQAMDALYGAKRRCLRRTHTGPW